jgi:hypothetical protein
LRLLIIFLIIIIAVKIGQWLEKSEWHAKVEEGAFLIGDNLYEVKKIGEWIKKGGNKK